MSIHVGAEIGLEPFLDDPLMELFPFEITLADFLLFEKNKPQFFKPPFIGIFDTCSCMSSMMHLSKVRYIMCRRAGFQIQVC